MSDRGYDRRQVAGRIAAAALLPFVTLSAPLSQLAARPARRAAPAGNFALQRMLTRDLGDGASITVTRRWLIGFSSAAPGLLVGGEQTFVAVAAPPSLAPLAALERARSTEGMFPIRLDGMGHIIGGNRAIDAAQLLRAIEVGQAMFENGPGGAAARQDASSFMAQLARMGAHAVSAMPRDLFFPAAGHGSATRDVTLPGAGTGTISISTDASVSVTTGLLRASQRAVVTRVGSSVRTSREDWLLTPLG